MKIQIKDLSETSKAITLVEKDTNRQVLSFAFKFKIVNNTLTLVEL